MTFRAWILATAMAGCTGDAATNNLEFHAEQAVLPGFGFDTGLLPSGSPVQLRLAVSAGGSLKATAAAVAGGDGAERAVVGTPGSGTFALDAHVVLDGTLHVDAAGQKYDGPIPGIENIDIAFGGQAAFDPFLVGGKAHVAAMLPKIDLPPIPLPGGLPGHLQLTVTEGSHIDVDLAGTCAGFEGTTAQWHAHTTTTAHVVIAPSIVLQVPVVGDKTFQIPDVAVDVPALDAGFDFDDREFLGGGARPPGTAVAMEGGCSGASPGGPGGPGGPGPTQACSAALPADFAPVWHPPNGSHANACTTTALASFASACLAETATHDSCAQFRTDNAACSRCLITESTAPGYGAIVAYPIYAVGNFAGCVALVAPDQLACAKASQALDTCLATACTGCAAGADTDACVTSAVSGVCAPYATAAECSNTLPQAVIDACSSIDQVDALFCGP